MFCLRINYKPSDFDIDKLKNLIPIIQRSIFFN